MEKRLRSSLQTSAENFLSQAKALSLKTSKQTLKDIIFNIKPNSDLTTSIPLSLLTSISKSLTSLTPNPQNPPTPQTPPSKKPRRSTRNVEKFQPCCPFQALQIYTHIVLLCTQHPKRVFAPQDLLPIVRELHDNLILFETNGTLLSEIASLCEEWWKEGLVGREMLISQFLPFLVSRSLTLRKKVDVHRVYALREAFVLFDFEDESIEDLKMLLIRCVITPLYLKTEDGRRFIAFLFGLSVQLLKEALAMIRSQIPFGRKSMLEAYGEIVFRGWKSSVEDGEFRREIEEGFLQGLIEAATLASNASLAASVRRVLGGFSTQKTTDGVEKLLFRLAEPVIFRSLQVANSNVRQNALHLLLDMFPLEDPDASKEDKDTMLDKQFFLLEKLLKDDCPEVRIVAVEGCCRILHLFWEIIPSTIITKMVTIIFDDMSRDMANDVRLSSVNGIIYLLGNPQAHEVLKVLLPRMGTMILDPVLSIRTATADLLLVIMDIRGFQFNKVVKLDSVLIALADDQPPVAQRITRLLMPSYFPSTVNTAEACTRFITLIKRSPMAGARFCEFALSEGASSKSLLELARVLTNFVLSSHGLDASYIKGVFVAIANLCNCLVKSSRKEALRELFTGAKLKGLLAAAAVGHAQSSLFDIVSVVTPAGVTGLLEECISIVTNCQYLPENSERQAEVQSAHKMVLSCNWVDDMLEALLNVLQLSVVECSKYFGTDVPREIMPSAKRKKGKPAKMSGKGKNAVRNKPSTFKECYRSAVGVALQIKDLLASEFSRKAILQSDALKVAIISIRVLSEVSVSHCICCDFMDSSLIEAYMALSLHMTLQNVSLSSHGDHNSISQNVGVDADQSMEQTILDETLDHLLNCTGKILNAGSFLKFGSLFAGCKLCSDRASLSEKQKQTVSNPDGFGADNEGSAFSYRRRMLNLVKIITVILKSIVDIASMDLLSHSQPKCLSFTSMYLQSLISTLKRSFNDELKFEEVQLKEIFICLKSSFTYAAKLLNVVLASVDKNSPAPQGVYDVSNHLLDLVVSTELYCGSGYTMQLVTLANQWLPDLILGLGSRYMLKHSLEEILSFYESSDGEMQVHPWLSILANMELHAIRDAASEVEGNDGGVEQEKLPAFKKLIEMMIQMLQINHEILDIVGLIYLAASVTGLQRKDFGLVLGLVHFVFVKLLKHEDVQLEKLETVMSYLQELYPQIESRIEETESTEEGFQELLDAKALLEPLWLFSCDVRGTA